MVVDTVTEARSVPKKVRIFGSYESTSSVADSARVRWRSTWAQWKKST